MDQSFQIESPTRWEVELEVCFELSRARTDANLTGFNSLFKAWQILDI